VSSNAHLAKALLGFQKDAPAITLDATNPHFGSKFASLNGVVAAVRPALNKNGLVYMQFPTNLDGAPALETMLIHAESGEDIAAVTPLILSKIDPQGYGSALTYARRYALLSILGLVGDEDDDANSASNGSAAATGASDRGKPSSAADVILHFSKNKGKRLGDLTPKQLQWYATEWEPNPEYANEQDRALKEAALALHLGTEGIAAPVDDLADVPF